MAQVSKEEYNTKMSAFKYVFHMSNRVGLHNCQLFVNVFCLHKYKICVQELTVDRHFI